MVGPRGGRALWVLAVVLSFVAGFAWANTVPELVGTQEEEAVASLSELDAEITIEHVDSTERIGSILAQIPEAGEPLGASRLIFIRVSAGVSVPELRGLAEDEAKTSLQSAGLAFQSTLRRDPEVGQGFVADQIPVAGARLDASSEVVFIVVSDGYSISVPPLVGVEMRNALARLTALGLKGEPDPPNPVYVDGGKGPCAPTNYYKVTVTETAPAMATPLAIGSVVGLKYSREWESQVPGGPCNEEGVPY